MVTDVTKTPTSVAGNSTDDTQPMAIPGRAAPMTVLGHTERAGVTAPPPSPRPGLVLPVPPRDDEKYRYVRRNAWMLTLFSLASFPLLLFSQVRLMFQYHWF